MGLRNRWNYSGYPYFVTTTVVEWANIFKSAAYFNIVCKSLNYCRDKYDCRIMAYCVMPNHVHLVLWPPRNASISDFMRDFKKFTSVQIRRLLEQNNETDIIELLKRNSKGYKGQTYKLWQDRFDDLVLTEEHTLKAKISYIHENPVRKGLVSQAEDWVYSSAAAHMSKVAYPVAVETVW